MDTIGIIILITYSTILRHLVTFVWNCGSVFIEYPHIVLITIGLSNIFCSARSCWKNRKNANQNILSEWNDKEEAERDREREQKRGE